MQRGLFETAAGERFVVGRFRGIVPAPCSVCRKALMPRQIVVRQQDAVMCVTCMETMTVVQRIRAGRKSPEGDRILSQTRRGVIRWRRRGVTTVHLRSEYRIGTGRRVMGDTERWQTSIVAPVKIGATRLLVPLVWEAAAGGAWPSEELVTNATINRLQERLDHPQRFLSGQIRFGDHLQSINGERSWMEERSWILES